LQNNPGQEHGNFRPRAERFPIRTPLRYRGSGESAWSEGTTLNISRSGVFFRAEKEVDLKTVLEMRILFPADVAGETPANVLCWGPVVRTVPPESPHGLPAVAVEILRYRFARDEADGEPRATS
jgi:PilZ domain